MKAVVLEIRGEEAAILLMDGSVRRVRGRYAVGQEIDYSAPVGPAVYRWVAAVIVAALLLTGSAGMYINNNYVACAEVSMDAGPAIVYTLNRRNRVLSVEAVNDDAEAVVSALRAEDVRFMPIDDAVEKTIDLLAEEGYLDADSENYVLAGISTDDARAKEALTGMVEAAMKPDRDGAPAVTYQIEQTDRAAAREARAQGMTPGRYAAGREAPEGRGPEEVMKLPVEEIMGKGEADAPRAAEGPAPQQPADTKTNGEAPPAGGQGDAGEPAANKAEPQRSADESKASTDAPPADAQSGARASNAADAPAAASTAAFADESGAAVRADGPEHSQSAPTQKDDSQSARPASESRPGEATSPRQSSDAGQSSGSRESAAQKSERSSQPSHSDGHGEAPQDRSRGDDDGSSGDHTQGGPPR